MPPASVIATSSSEVAIGLAMKGAEMDKAMADLQVKLAAMPPDQRKQIEA